MKNLLVKTGLKYGLLAGVISTLPFFILQYLELKPLINIHTLFIDGLMMALFVAFALKEFKIVNPDGELHFWQGMTVGFFVYLSCSVIFAAFLYIYISINPEYLAMYQADAAAYLQQSRVQFPEQFDADTFDRQMAVIAQVTIGDLAWSGFMKKIIVGLFVTPVLSIAFRSHSTASKKTIVDKKK